MRLAVVADAQFVQSLSQTFGEPISQLRHQAVEAVVVHVHELEFIFDVALVALRRELLGGPPEERVRDRQLRLYTFQVVQAVLGRHAV